MIGTPCIAARAQPVRVTARLSSPLVAGMPPALDAMLMGEIARVEGLPPYDVQVDSGAVEDVAIPLAEAGGVYLASWALFEAIHRETTYRNKRLPLAALLAHLDTRGRKSARYDTVTGRGKPLRIPEERVTVRELVWYALGDAEAIRAVVAGITAVGGRRGAGAGVVASWTVDVLDDADVWSGFPVVLDGAPLRSLPQDWPGVESGATGMGRLRPPYWYGPRVPVLQPEVG